MDVLGVIVMAVMTLSGAELSGIWCWAFTRRIPSKPDLCRVFGSDSGDTFCCFLYQKQMLDSKALFYYEKIMILLDAIGLGAFTVIGVETAYEIGYVHH